MEPVPLTERDTRKAAYRQAQAEARLLAERVNQVFERPVLEVSASPQVWVTEDGAFVEAVVWIPRGEQKERT
jgi:hypothetical protein